MRPEVAEILRLASDVGAIVNLGYVSPAECRAAVESAPAGCRLLMTNPHSAMGQSAGEIVAMVERGVRVELTAYSMHPDGRGRRDPAPALDRAVEVIRLVGVEQCVLSSDGGMVDAPPPRELLAWVAGRLHERGITMAELRQLVSTNPERLLAVS